MSKSILQDEKKCFVTGYEGKGLHKHHIMNGPNRTFSEEDGLYVYLKSEHHIADSNYPTPHNDRKTDLFYKRMAQRKYEETHTREEWLSRYGRNYLDWEVNDD